MNTAAEALFRENITRMRYDEFMEWKTIVFDKIPRDSGKILAGRGTQPADCPTEPVLLVRGGGSTDCMSWAKTPSVAEKFMKHRGGRLWACEAPPEAILAVITHERPGKDEYVIDPELVEPVDITEGVSA